MAGTSAGFCVLFMLMLIHAPVQTTMVIKYADKLTEKQADISEASELNEDVSAVDQNIRWGALDTIVTDIREVDKPHQGYSIKRRKRSGRFIALSFIKGLAATKSLLFGSTPARSSNLYYNEFYKRGNFATAMRDFESVNPTHVLQSKDPSGMTIKRGMVGDRMIVIESSGEIGRPTIEIVQGTGSTKPFIDKITYVD